MRPLALRSVLLGFWLTLGSTGVWADCTEDRRKVELDKDNILQLRTYTCRTAQGAQGADAAQVRIEIHRLSNLAASMVVAKQSSALLAKAVGAPRLIENDVSATYSELVRRFGRTVRLTTPTLKVDAAGADGGSITPEVAIDQTIKVLPEGLRPYPAAEELDGLQKKTIVPALKYFYEVECKDGGTTPGSTDKTSCAKYDPKPLSMRFWRSIRADDLKNFPSRITAYNKRFAARGDSFPSLVPQELQLAGHLAGDNWPDDLVLLIGTADKDGCNAGFQFVPRLFLMDVAVVENLSSVPVTVDGVLGGRAPDTRLRVAGSSGAPAGARDSLATIGTLAPGEKALLPMKITLSSEEFLTDIFGYRQASTEIQKRIGANGFRGNVTGHAAPTFQNYLYGPELVIGGISVNGKRVDLAGRSANRLEMTMSGEIGSCPYLLSSNGKDADWIEHGKVLDKAPSRQREYADTRTLAGFHARFRLEEREPEIAFIDHVELSAVLKTGETVALAPDNARLAARDGDYLRLYWGDAVEIAFALPEGVAEADVVESRFTVTGYYLRYSSLMAQRGAATSRRLSGLASPFSDATRGIAETATADALTCPAPASFRASVINPQ
jgi:hypothetical protein